MIVYNLLTFKTKKDKNSVRFSKIANVTNARVTMNDMNKLLLKFKTNLEKTILNVKASPRKVSVHLKIQPDGKRLIEGIDIAALNLMASCLNFTPKLSLSYRHELGYVYDNGSRTQAILDLFSRKMDININRYISVYNNPVVTLPSSFVEEHCFIMQKDERDMFAIFSGFEVSVWLTIGVTYVLYSLVWK